MNLSGFCKTFLQKVIDKCKIINYNVVNTKTRKVKKMVKKSKSVTVRFAENDYKYLKAVAKLAGQNVSGYIRMLANMSITAVKVKVDTGELKREDVEALFND